MRKKGELTSSQIIGMVLTIGGFVVLLVFLLVFLDLGKQTEREICELSVVSRATAPETVNTYIPLNCKTQKICISENEDCEGEFFGEERVEKVEIRGDDVELIEETFANAMFDCWAMMGEGKLDLFSGGAENVGLRSGEVDCVICSRIVLNVSDDISDRVDVKEYLRTTTVPGSDQSYLNTFLKDSGTDSYALPSSGEKDFKDVKEIKFSDVGGQYAVVFTQIKPNSYTDTLNSLLKFGAAGAGAVFMMPVVDKLTAGFLGSGTGLFLAGATASGITIYSMANVHAGKAVAGGYCGQFTSKESAEANGCSMVQILPYDTDAINSICANIESKP